VVPTLVSRAYTHASSYYLAPRNAVVLHNTVGGSDLTTFQSLGSWHYLIGRSGVIYRDVPESLCAWHAARVDRWRPDWAVDPPDFGMGPANYSSLGIELTSLAGHPTLAWPTPRYTDAQYEALRRLLDWITDRYGPLPVVGHGQMQLDRTDPVDFSWERLGCTVWAPGYGYFWPQPGHEPPDAGEIGEDDVIEIGDAELVGYLSQLGYPVNPETAIVKRAMLAYRRGETRGPAISGEYPALSPSGKPVIRQKFTAGICEFSPETGEASWAEAVLFPEAA
jgi:N-acetyl-anhydromuramyl-L-alanine amidase AmpD